VSAMPKSVVPTQPRLLFGKLGVDDLDALMAIENDVYPFPWTRGNFLDSLYNGYEAWVMRDEDGVLLGYFLLMLALDEAHLLNISLRRDLHGKGLGRTLLDKAVEVARDKGAVTMLLEVRPSNQRALQVYERYGFLQVGRRKGYYPANANAREDAIVMRLEL
jgi:[ribosomal protein S18]-alanine N-acetyltransferase